MGERRQLNEEERAACLRAKARLEVDLQIWDHKQGYFKHMTEKGLYADYLSKLRDFQRTLREAENEYTAAVESLKIVNDQLENGVEIKETTETTDIEAGEEHAGG